MPHSIRTFQEVLVAVAALTAAAAPFAAPTVSAAGSDGEMVKQTFPIPGVGGDLGEPDRGFHRFDLAEERTDAAEFVMTPMPEQPGGLRRDLPLIRIRQRTPCVYISANFIDD